MVRIELSSRCISNAGWGLFLSLNIIMFSLVVTFAFFVSSIRSELGLLETMAVGL